MIGMGTTLVSPVGAEPPAPYGNPSTNHIYNLLFCDDPTLFKPKPGETAADWQALLFGQNPHPEAIRAFADAADMESRVRLLAYGWLRNHQQAVPAKRLLGVVVEVPLEHGLDTLAAYADGRVRYINQTGKMSIYEGAPPPVASKAKEVLAAAQPAVDRLGPWDKPRLPAPKPGNIRLTFLVSDGLYFGEGPFETMQTEPLAAPIIQKATELLQLAAQAVEK